MRSTAPAALSYHLRRYAANLDEIPYGYFSILQELTVRLIGPMEARGYVLSEGLVPDISSARLFCHHLREFQGLDTDSLPTYRHRFENGRIVMAKLYPNELWPHFIRNFSEVWLPTRAVDYFSERDPKAVPYLLDLMRAVEAPR